MQPYWKFEKTGEQILAKVREKIDRTNKRLEEVQAALNKKCAELGMEAATIAEKLELIEQMSQALSVGDHRGFFSGAIVAGIKTSPEEFFPQVQGFKLAKELLAQIKSERGYKDRLEVLFRNVDPKKTYELTFNELEELRF